jgi:riboflavin kinase/FMN adenylyltransferase
MMELHNNQIPVPQHAKGAIVAIGNFDGVHPGHQALIAAAAELAQSQAAPLAVLTFEPHPREYFQPQGDPFRLTLPAQKQKLIGALGVQHLFSLPFDERLASLEAEEFIRHILVKTLAVRHVVVGEDFSFGRGRGGNVATLKKSGTFGVTALPPVLAPDGMAYSSTRARAALAKADFAALRIALGRDWELEMPVVHGDKRGRELGYPTANQQADRYQRLPYGIYAVKVREEGAETWRDGVANFGIRPMFRIEQPIFETYIFDFTGDLYGKNLTVRPVAFLRGEQAFQGLDALTAQIKQDCQQAAAVLKSTPL